MSKLFATLLFPLIFNPSGKTWKIAVIDTGYNTKNYSFTICPEGAKDFTGYGMHDVIGHGQNVSHIIWDRVKNKSNVCLIPIKFFHKDGEQNSLSRLIQSLKYAASIPNLDMVNFSGGGYDSNSEEKEVILNLLNKNVIIVVAAGNDKQDLNKIHYYPATYHSRIVVVGNKAKSSNYGDVVDVIEDGNNVSAGGVIASGTSQATPKITARILNYLNK